jgi:hypothetical protein
VYCTTATGCQSNCNLIIIIIIIIIIKAYDSVPHSWVEKSIELVGVNSKIVRFCKLSMKKWNKRLSLKTQQEVMQSQPIQIRRGIFQGDSLSPLLFCIALIPLTNELNRADCGYQIHGTERKISHLLYRIFSNLSHTLFTVLEG